MNSRSIHMPIGIRTPKDSGESAKNATTPKGEGDSSGKKIGVWEHLGSNYYRSPDGKVVDRQSHKTRNDLQNYILSTHKKR